MAWKNSVLQYRRKFSVEYKLALLKKLDECNTDVGQLLRSENIHYSQICEWRKLRTSGKLGVYNMSDSETGLRYEEMENIEYECLILTKRYENMQSMISNNRKELAKLYSEAIRLPINEMIIMEIKNLAKITGVQAACEVANFPRASFYRYLKNANLV